MKNRLTLLLSIVMWLNQTTQAQITLPTNSGVPQRFSYSSKVIDAMGAPIADRFINLRFTIQADSSVGGAIQYVETDTITTTHDGVFTVVIGGGEVANGNFDSIQWSLGKMWLNVEVDENGGTNFVSIGRMEILSTPYAITAGNGISNVVIDSTGRVVITTTDNRTTTSSQNSLWLSNGNYGLGAASFIGTNDNVDFVVRRNGQEKMRMGAANTDLKGAVTVETGLSVGTHLNVGSGANIGADAYIMGNATVAGSSTVAGNSSIAGSQTIGVNQLISGNSAVSGNHSVGNNLNVSGNANVNGNSSVVGNDKVMGNSSVMGNAGFGGIVNPATAVEINGALALRDTSISVSGPFTINVANRSFVKVSSSVNQGNAPCTLTNGTVTGQILFIMVSNPANPGKGIKFFSGVSPNVKLSTLNFAPDDADGITFLWTGDYWVEVSRTVSY